MTTKTQAGDFTTGSIPVKLIKFMLPVLGALVLQAMYGAVDLLVVGRFGSSAGISGVATGGSLVNLFTFVVTALTMGVTVLIGRYIGEGRQDRIGPVIGGAICFFAATAIALSVIMVIFAPVFADWLSAPREARDLTITYIRICGGGMCFIVAYNVISGIFRGLGDSRHPLIFVAIACCVNIVGDLVLVAGFHMDVAGAAIATIAAQGVSVVISLVIIRMMRDVPFNLRRQDIRFNGEIKLFLGIGAPLAIQEFLVEISFLIMCAIVNALGLDASSGYGVAQKLVSFIMLVPSAIMQSMAAFVAQNVGAGEPVRARRAMAFGMAFGAAIGVVVFTFIFFRGDIPSSWFTGKATYIAKSHEYLKGFGLDAVLTCVLFSYMGYFNGNDRAVFTMIQSLVQTFAVRIPVAWIMSRQASVTLTRIGLAAPAASTVGILLCTVYYFHMKKTMPILN